MLCSSCGTSSRRRSKRERRRTQGREGERGRDRERERREAYTACRRARARCNSLQHNPVLFSRVPKKCTSLDLSLFYILISGESSNKRSLRSFLQKIKMPSTARQRFTRGDHFDLFEKRIFLFSIFLFPIFANRTLFWNESRTNQPRRGYVDRGRLILPCPW